MTQTSRRISYVFLCALPFIDVVVIGTRGLRIPGVYQSVGGLLFTVTLIAAWMLGARVIGSGAAGRQRLAAAGALLILPWAINSLLWVGLGAPFQATESENYMRFLVLLSNSIIVASAFIALKEELHDAGDRFYSTIGLAASIPAGAAYFLCMSIIVASHISSTKGESFASYLSGLFSVTELFACVLTYVATAAFAASLGQIRWLGRRAVGAYVILSLSLLMLVVVRGLSYPDLSSDSAPWYVQPGFIAGIPAVPWIMPCLLGVILLRRAGDGQP